MQRAGIALAKANDQKAYRGRKPTFSRQQVEEVLALAGQGQTASEIATSVGLQRMAVTRIVLNPANAERQLATWNM
jgi:hypothetical protein